MQTFALPTGFLLRITYFIKIQTRFIAMTKRILLYIPVVVLGILLLACKNKNESTETANVTAPGVGAGERPQGSGGQTMLPEKIDTAFGLKGCDRAGFRNIKDKIREFTYDGYRVRLVKRDNEAGENIEVIIDSTGRSLLVPNVEATYFAGGAFGHIFVDIGSDPEVRDILVYNLKRGSLAQVYRERYCVAGETFVSSNGGLWFYCPVDEMVVNKKPECPEQAEWLNKGLKVGYGQKYLYDLLNRGLTRKSEFICLPFKK